MNTGSFLLAHRLKAGLRDGKVDAATSMSIVRGTLVTRAALARVEIHIGADFEEVMQAPPPVWCCEPWMRHGEEWHNDEHGGMCWVLRDEWRDIFASRDRLKGDEARVAADWLLHNVRSLISRHYYASLVGLKRWPKAWDAWGHQDKGVAEYERERDKQAG
jgi:hypothetical protein